jgi:hypothetical protein
MKNGMTLKVFLLSKTERTEWKQIAFFYSRITDCLGVDHGKIHYALYFQPKIETPTKSIFAVCGQTHAPLHLLHTLIYTYPHTHLPKQVR